MKRTSVFKHNIIFLIYTAYLLVASTFYGCQIVGFLISYANLDETAIFHRLSIWVGWQQWVNLIFALMVTLAFILRYQILEVFGMNKKLFFRRWYIQFLILLIAVSNIVLNRFDNQIQIFHLLVFALCIWASVLIASQFYHSGILAWRHPATIGSSVVSTLLLGISVITISGIFKDEANVSVFWFILLILFDMFIFFARFRYLSKADASTYQIAQKLMGSLLLFTGMRVILGIFIPLVYSVYLIFTQRDFGNSIALMVIIGQIIDRYLFLYEINQKRF